MGKKTGTSRQHQECSTHTSHGGGIFLCLRDWELPLMLEGRQVRRFPIPLTPQRRAQRLEDTSPVLQYRCPLPGAHEEDAHRPRERCRHGEAETPASWSHLSWGWGCCRAGTWSFSLCRESLGPSYCLALSFHLLLSTKLERE